jgi:hypothetical protein
MLIYRLNDFDMLVMRSCCPVYSFLPLFCSRPSFHYVLKCADAPEKQFWYKYASLRSNSMSFSNHCLVGKACKNIMISCEIK